MSGYRNPLRRARVTGERVDMGVDYGGSGPVFALGAGTIEQVYNSGWPGGTFIAELIADGPLAGQYVYVAEDVAPAVSVGQHVTPRTVIGDLNGQMETGFAAGPPNLGTTMAAASGQIPPSGDPGAYPTVWGERYNKLLVSLGAPAGTLSGPPVSSAGGGLSGSAGGLFGSLKGLAVSVPIVLAAAALGVWGIGHATGLNKKAKQAYSKAASAAQTAALAAA